MKRAPLVLLVSALVLTVEHARADPPARPVLETLDLAIVRRAIHRGGRDALEACWRAARAEAAADRGRVVVLFSVGEDGRVSRVEILSSELGASLAECAAAAIRAVELPPSRSTLTVTFPIDFVPSPAPTRVPRVSLDPRRPYRVVP
jgi:TonB family protein